ncbi:hypothetical protein FB567DRAFT_602017 [Paraphoma chrysanthemicola]|uniref:Uncharacterized protein n=1 Tax=Paraphoma chrysanthemicola TaxID=798071 RepID=A0A8K0RJ54_9PLEO|nr:hypothetical protein FB567DRAFT_602017 [Paraphoma chrysanthemicola]
MANALHLSTELFPSRAKDFRVAYANMPQLLQNRAIAILPLLSGFEEEYATLSALISTIKEKMSLIPETIFWLGAIDHRTRPRGAPSVPPTEPTDLVTTAQAVVQCSPSYPSIQDLDLDIERQLTSKMAPFKRFGDCRPKEVMHKVVEGIQVALFREGFTIDKGSNTPPRNPPVPPASLSSTEAVPSSPPAVRESQTAAPMFKPILTYPRGGFQMTVAFPQPLPRPPTPLPESVIQVTSPYIDLTTPPPEMRGSAAEEEEEEVEEEEHHEPANSGTPPPKRRRKSRSSRACAASRAYEYHSLRPQRRLPFNAPLRYQTYVTKDHM